MNRYEGEELPQGIEIRENGKVLSADEVVARLSQSEGISDMPESVLVEKSVLIDFLRDSAMDEAKVDTCYDQPNKNPRLAQALNDLADLVSGFPKTEGE